MKLAKIVVPQFYTKTGKPFAAVGMYRAELHVDHVDSLELSEWSVTFEASLGNYRYKWCHGVCVRIVKYEE